MNDRGMTAFVDATVFLVVIMMALSVTFGMHGDGWKQDNEASEVMESLCSIEVRMSDVSENGDFTLVYLTDMLAYGLWTGDDGPFLYLEDVLESHCRGKPYHLRMSFASAECGHMDETTLEGELGDPDGTFSTGSERDVLVSAGGTLHLELRM